MTGQRIGYVRVSSDDQNTARQLDGLHLDRTFTDHASGATADRHALGEMIAYARAGDEVVVHSLDRLARSLTDLRQIIDTLTGKGVALTVHTQGLRFTGDDTPMNTLLLSMLGAVAEFERAMIRERQAEGIVKAKARGVYKGRKPSLGAEQVAVVRERHASGEAVTAIAADLQVARGTVYKALRTGSVAAVG